MDLMRVSRKRGRPGPSDDPPGKIQKVIAQGEIVQVFVKLPAGRTLQIKINPSKGSGLDLKNKIIAQCVAAQASPLEPNQMILVSGGKFIDNLTLLIDINIQQDSLIFVAAKPPPSDILNFDQCHYCRCEAMDPLVLPCGHSCCKTCVPFTATTCPVPGCQSSLNGQTRDTLPLNWIAGQFRSPKEQEPPESCQICAEEGTLKEATHWCESCSKISSPEYFCSQCILAEHSNRTNKNHNRFPITQMPLALAFTTCPTHQLPQDSFCFDDKILLCHRCVSQGHKTHNTKLVVDSENELKNRLSGSLLVAGSFDTHQAALKKARERKQEELKELERRILAVNEEIKWLDATAEKVQQQDTRSKAGSLTLTKAIKDFPQRDLFNKKMELLEERVNQASSLLGAEKLMLRGLNLPCFREKYTLQHEITLPPGIMANFGFICDQNLRAYAINAEAGQIHVFEKDGSYLYTLGKPTEFVFPLSLAFTLDGSLVVLTLSGHIYIIDPRSGERITTFSQEKRFLEPYCIRVDRDGNFVVVDSGHHKIQIFSPQGDWIREFGGAGTGLGQMFSPKAVAISPEGNYVVSDSGNARIQIFDPTGRPILAFGVKGKYPGYLSYPWGLAVDADHNILVNGDSGLQIFDKSGTFLRLLGTKKEPIKGTPFLNPDGTLQIGRHKYG